ncbi:MAG TPA: hypothetical protein DCS43_14950 [Verrucomicrobia bacterium]|nr:hypothetical protein [Verrucomicrobiota bacterium]
MDNEQGKTVIRELAKRYADIAALPRQKETIDGWRRLNGLKQTRPMVRIEQLPWHELGWGEDRMVNREGLLQDVERRLRMAIYAWDHFKADMVILPYFSISKTVRNDRLGPAMEVERKGLSQHFTAQLATIADVQALKTPVIEVDPELDKRRLELVSALFDGIMPVRLTGIGRHSGLWDLISTKISPERMLYDLIDRPEYVTVLINKFVEMESGVLDQYEAHGLLEAAPPEIHCTGAFCDELPSAHYDGKKATAKDTWVFSMAQMFSEVSPAMQEEYDIIPLKPLLERYGLVYYGCCEPLHNKIDIVRQIKNVRKISISPWANKEIAAEKIHGDYVFSAKPNPSYVAMGSFDAALVRKDLEETVEICRRYNTPCELILKDVSTVCNDPSRLTQWEQIAMDVVGA